VICHVTDSDGKCTGDVDNVTLMVCRKHYARYVRHGSYETRPPYKGGRRAPTPERARELMSRRRSRQVDIERKMSSPCMCLHAFQQHSKGNGSLPRDEREHCLYSNCECTEYEEANKIAVVKAMTKLDGVGFSMYLNGTAMCICCMERYPIGKWSDPHSLRRALVHRRQACPKRQSLLATGTNR
jgi:hypothetical protein